jgi:DNA invertase Pin-like site-specific DNA recombinase
MTTAYSYIRFSSLQQLGGDSLRRQTEASRQYAADNNLNLDETLNVRDLGVSAYQGKNFEEGALGKFLAAVDEGKVSRDSYLLVESLDRLSRLPVMDALKNFNAIISKGITIVTLMDKAVYSKESLNSNWTGLIVALATMARANDESAAKSTRANASWQNKKAAARDEKTPIGNNAPLWLDYTQPEEKDSFGSYTENKERADIVRKVFQWAIDGYGRTVIAKMLNADGTASFKCKTWGNSSIQKILTNKAVLGIYQPHTGRGSQREPQGEAIPGFYPQVIEESTFYQAQEAMQSRRISKATNPGKRFNVWQGVALCAHCRASMHIINKGKQPKGGTYIRCSNAKKGLCTAKNIRLDQSELVFREILAKVGNLSLVQDSAASLANQLREVNGRLTEQQDKMRQHEASMRDYPSSLLAKLVQECEQTIASLNKDKETLQTALATSTIVNKAEFFAKLDTSTYEGRAQANGLLKRLKIRVAIKTDSSIIKGFSAYYIIQDRKIVLVYMCIGDVISAQPVSDEQREIVDRQDWPKEPVVFTMTQDMLDGSKRRARKPKTAKQE